MFMKGERKMDFGVTGKLGGYYLVEQYRKNVAADKNGGASFVELAAAKAAGKTENVSAEIKVSGSILQCHGYIQD